MKRAPSQKLEKLFEVLSEPQIHSMELKNIAFTGIPDECKGLRAYVWKLLLNYLPWDNSEMNAELASQRANYNNFRDLFLQNPENENPDLTEEDKEFWEDIEKDVKRTRPEMHFFFLPNDRQVEGVTTT